MLPYVLRLYSTIGPEDSGDRAMRTLLIDNYDSFTFNVAQAIAAVNGEPPLVIRNDEYRFDALLELKFDNVVISPGPGSPANERDFGVCRAVVEDARWPILGICMGFQGIALLAGARVDRAPEPWHGRGCFINHDGTGLFDGMPSPFFGIRYHSLHVPSLDGTDLIETARTDDGLLMAFRHRDKPIWGVQFHPESVSTDSGRRIFENFRDLSLRRVRPGARSSRAGATGRRSRNRSETDRLPLQWRKISDAAPAETVFSDLFGERSDAVWLDSNAELAGRSRFSFMGAPSAEADAVLTYRSRTRTLEIRDAAGTRTRSESVFDYLKHELAAREADASGLPFEFAGGYIGYFGYELKGECGGQYHHESDLPDAYFIRVSRFVAFDHASSDCYVVAVGNEADGGEVWIDETVERIARLTPPESDEGGGDNGVTSFHLEQDRDRYMAGIGIALDKIRSGESYQVCLTNRTRGPFRGDPLGLYRVLRRRNPAPFSAFLRAGDFAVLCSSPERFIHISTEGTIETRPIKGTAPRSDDPERDRRYRLDLVDSEKNRSENLMIADLLRNDLGRVAEVDTVRVPSLMALESYQTVHHLVSTVQATLSADHDAIDCIRAAFPGGSMTGAPKIRTMEIIDDLESSARGVYSGALGYLSWSGAVDLNIVIRTMVVAGGEITIGMGGGIVALSDPADEFDEAVLKGRALVEAVQEYADRAARDAHTIGRRRQGDVGSS